MKNKRYLIRSFTLITAGMFFLINPLINIVDILPDAIGYILIFMGLGELSFLDGRMDSARKKLEFLIVISIFKLALTPSVAMSSISSDRLLATFSFAIVELILFTLFYRDFFEGFTYLAERNKGDKTLVKIPNARFLTALFFFSKIGLSVLPELYALAENKMIFEVSNYEFYESLIKSKPFTQAFSILTVFIAGIFWFVNIVIMLKTAKKDTEFTEQLHNRFYHEYLVFPEKQNLKALKNGVFVLIAALLFFLDIAVDGIRIFPEALSIVLIATSAFIMSKFGRFEKTKKLAIFVIAIQIIVELYRYLYIDTNALFSEISLLTVLTSAIVTIIKSGASILFLSVFLKEFRFSYYLLTGDTAPTFDLTKFMFLIITALKSLQIILPTVFAATSFLYILLVGIWIYLCGKNIFYIYESYDKKVNLL